MFVWEKMKLNSAVNFSKKHTKVTENVSFGNKSQIKSFTIQKFSHFRVRPRDSAVQSQHVLVVDPRDLRQGVGVELDVEAGVASCPHLGIPQSFNDDRRLHVGSDLNLF